MAFAMPASAAGIMDIGKSPGRASTFLHNVVCFFTTTVAKPGSNASFWCCASVMIAVVLNFLSHDGSPLKVGVGVGRPVGVAGSVVVRSIVGKDVSVLGWRIARSNVAGHSLTA
jgi:hypothetical protein